jgi:(1->4)-alpha-D-glucan 1-alpha-D-glucosylmutase
MGESTGHAPIEALYSEVVAMLREGRASTRRPASTYRLQLTRAFGFDQAAAVVPYLHHLGITDVYLSPILAACGRLNGIAGRSQHPLDAFPHGSIVVDDQDTRHQASKLTLRVRLLAR